MKLPDFSKHPAIQKLHKDMGISGDPITVFDKEQPLPVLQEIVGGWIEHVPLPDGRCMWVNEEGLMKGLPYNPQASEMAGRRIVGPVAITPPEEDFEDEDDGESHLRGMEAFAAGGMDAYNEAMGYGVASEGDE